jgi:hypothetical protein
MKDYKSAEVRIARASMTKTSRVVKGLLTVTSGKKTPSPEGKVGMGVQGRQRSALQPQRMRRPCIPRPDPNSGSGAGQFKTYTPFCK